MLFHGTGCSPSSYWLPCVKKEFGKKGLKSGFQLFRTQISQI